MPETDFKQKKLIFFFLLTIICPSQGEASRVKKKPQSSTFKDIYFYGFRSDIGTPDQV